MTHPLVIYALAALGEMVGCYGFWLCWREGQPAWLLLPAMASLGLFAWLLTKVPVDEAGRAFAAYGGIYILMALFWMWLVDGVHPDKWDCCGALLCLAGAATIILAPHQP
ncbi:YnfA family protein [Formicincola oecophyllae]|uniref:YnfA family protein n=1 Tax=Formicincola oecophyllae TaxID=2558361 RepID=A0A4Y6U7G1_9PROT|nr:YnfA family protein [Formicincola oecophyllae]QDH13343.1 YnfA family protein [Formicincola oecophyllae]